MSTNIHSEGGAGSPSWPGLERDLQGLPETHRSIEARPESRPHLESGLCLQTKSSKAWSASEPCVQTATPGTPTPSRLWLWFVAAFLIQAAAWTIWFTIASQHRIED